jgi:hypothetical protein
MRAKIVPLAPPYDQLTALVFVDSEKKKLSDRARIGKLIGYDNLSAAYRVDLPSERRVIKSTRGLLEITLKQLHPLPLSTQDLGHCCRCPNILTRKWIFKVKRDESGNSVKFKARLVVRGFKQVEGLDFDEFFSPVVRQNYLRLLLSLATVEDLEIQQLDVMSRRLSSMKCFRSKN